MAIYKTIYLRQHNEVSSKFTLA